MTFNQINLTTRDHADRRIVFALMGSAAVLLAMFTVANAIGGLRAYREQSAYRANIGDLQQQAQTLAARGEGKGAYDEAAAEALQQRSRHANYLIALDTFPWTSVLDELEKAIPPQIVLDRLLPAQDLRSIRMIGSTASVEPITQFQDALEKSGHFQSVVLENMDFGGGAKKNAPSVDGGTIQFDLTCALNLRAIVPEDIYGDLWMTMASARTEKTSKRRP